MRLVEDGLVLREAANVLSVTTNVIGDLLARSKRAADAVLRTRGLPGRPDSRREECKREL